MIHIKKYFGILLYIICNPIEFRFYNNFLGNVILKARITSLRLMGMRIGRNSRIHQNFYTNNPKLISIGDNCEIGRNAEIWAYDHVNIDDNVEIGSKVYINTSNHKFSLDVDMPISKQGSYSKSIKISKNSWLGANVNILSGVAIGSNSVIGANSVVTKNLPGQSVYAGVPAKKINDIE